MTLPTYSEDDHDIGLGASGAVKGYMRVRDSRLTRADALPGSSREANGESKFDTFVADSFFAQADFGGGVGQGRYVKVDTILSGIGDGRFQGHFFPGRLKATVNDGGSSATYGYFTRSGVIYGVTNTHFETIEDGGATTQYDRTDGTMYSQPVESGANNIFWVQEDSGRKLYKWTGPGGAFSDVTPSGVTPYWVLPYGRVMWCIGQRSVESDGTLVQSKSRSLSSTNNDITLSLNDPPKPGNTIVATVHNEGSCTWTASDSGWTQAEGNFGVWGCAIFYKTVSSGSETTGRFTASSATYLSGSIMEFSGIHAVSTFLDAQVDTDASADTTGNSGTLTAGTYGAIVVAATHNGSLGASSFTNSFTELFDFDFGTGSRKVVAYKLQTTSTSTAWTIAGGGSEHRACIFGLRPNTITTDQTQTVFLYTRDEGASWEEVHNGDSAGIPVPLYAYATQGAMWITTAQGLYKAEQLEREFEDHVQKINLTVTQVGDKFSVPYNTAAVGHVITSFGNFLYYPLGSTIWELAPSSGPGGGSGRQLWPPRDWDTTAGEIQWMASGEGGLFWGAGGYLWCYDGRGFHCLAAEPAADDFDYLFWHQGRLYFKDDPASYFDFRQPSTRPDVSFTDDANFTDGYIVSSYWDGGKVNEIKILREFFLQAEWTAASNAGTLTLSYLIADSGTHPERLGGGATSLSWVTVGTMTVSDGNFKTFSLSTPIEFKKIYFRIKIEKGTSGYPIVESYGANARTKMPDQLAFTLQLDIGTHVTNRQGVKIYPDVATVREAILALRALRSPSATPYYHTLQWTDGVSDNTSYTVTVDNLSETITGTYHDTTLAAEVFVTATELPG